MFIFSIFSSTAHASLGYPGILHITCLGIGLAIYGLGNELFISAKNYDVVRQSFIINVLVGIISGLLLIRGKEELANIGGWGGV